MKQTSWKKIKLKSTIMFISESSEFIGHLDHLIVSNWIACMQFGMSERVFEFKQSLWWWWLLPLWRQEPIKQRLSPHRTNVTSNKNSSSAMRTWRMWSILRCGALPCYVHCIKILKPTWHLIELFSALFLVRQATH